MLHRREAALASRILLSDSCFCFPSHRTLSSLACRRFFISWILVLMHVFFVVILCALYSPLLPYISLKTLLFNKVFSLSLSLSLSLREGRHLVSTDGFALREGRPLASTHLV